MNIKFLIGNGFDMALGLKSSYTDVERAYCRLIPKSKSLMDFSQSLYKSLVREENKKEGIADGQNSEPFDGVNWSNFELGMGKYTAVVSKEYEQVPNVTQENDPLFDTREPGMQEYEECMQDFITFLSNYLKDMEKRISYEAKQTEIRDKFKDAFFNFYDELELSYRQQIETPMQPLGTAVNFKVISFNYTHALEQCLKYAINSNGEIGTKDISGIKRFSADSRPIYLHGDLSTHIMAGLNDKSQIANPIWQENQRFRERFIKDAFNKKLGTLRESQARNEIKSSQLVCIFGMSMGETDRLWWELIGEQFVRPEFQLLIYEYNPHFARDQAYGGTEFDIVDDVKKHFLRISGLAQDADREKINGYMNRIQVVVNSKIFDIKLMPDDPDETAEHQEEKVLVMQ